MSLESRSFVFSPVPPPARSSVRRTLLCVLALVLVGCTSLTASAAIETRPRIDAVFVLDTTGSMSGLLEGAKRKIWSIADRIASAESEPEVRMGLIAYRDRGDAYVTQVYDLSSDLDALSSNLRMLQAGGGGDGPESVNQALHEAVSRVGWTPGERVYRVIFLVGDAPPHMDYENEVQYPAAVEAALGRGIVINTVQCGEHEGTEEIWREIAQRGAGEYAAISNDGGMVVVESPYDEELRSLQAQLAETVVPYGSSEERKELGDKLARSAAAPLPEAAARLSYLNRRAAGVVSGRSDLVDAVGSGKVTLEALPPEALPAELATLSESERARYLATKTKQRTDLNQAIGEVVSKRDAFLEQDAKQRALEGGEQGFDDRVLSAVREQAARKGIVYPSKDRVAP